MKLTPDEELFLRHWIHDEDGEWPNCDLAKQRELSEALTFDRHFVQAGFRLVS